VTPGPPRHILLTGFEPFDGDTVNPSGEVTKQLDGKVIGDCVVRSMILPVQHEAARAVVAPLLEAPGLVAVVHLGLAGGRARISLERVAVNVMDYSRPDAHGQVLCDVTCVEGGPAAYFSTLPLREILAALTAEGIPATISNTAGTYLCNDILYATLQALAQRGLSIPAGFIHLPFLLSMVTAHNLEEPSMDLATMSRGIEVALRDLIAQPASKQPRPARGY
jgi:pyroglutamyl-peptidase